MRSAAAENAAQSRAHNATMMAVTSTARMTMLRLFGTPLLLLSFLFISIKAQEESLDRSTVVRNESGHRILIQWVSPNDGERHLMSDPDGVLAGAEMALNSYVSHTFEIQEMPKKKTGKCDDENKCMTAMFTINENRDQAITIGKDFVLVHEDNKSKARKQAVGLMEVCKEQAKESLAGSANHTDLLEQYLACIGGKVEDELVQRAEEVTFQAEVRRDLAKLFEKYTCLDDELESSEPIREEEWYNDYDDVTREVRVLHDRPASRIHIIEDFIDDEECQAMQDTAEAQLSRAVVSDGAGGSTYSENRKAMQAGITVPWDKEADDHPIVRISRRVYNYTNHVLGLGIDEHGQEDLMSIQYFVSRVESADDRRYTNVSEKNHTDHWTTSCRVANKLQGKGVGLDRGEYDQYTPHCDGDCTGDPHRRGTRVATMVLYCTIPEVGGATNFRASGLHVHPTKGNAIFFSYINPETKIMDSGFTEHSGCPVIEGTKRIVTQWVRLGVDKENPWDSFNTRKFRDTVVVVERRYSSF